MSVLCQYIQVKFKRKLLKTNHLNHKLCRMSVKADIFIANYKFDQPRE